MVRPPKASHSERKCPKSALILTVNHPIHPYCKVKNVCPVSRLDWRSGRRFIFPNHAAHQGLIDWYLIRLLLDSLVFLYLVFYCAGFSPCGFSMCGFATSGFSMCGYSPCGGTKNTRFALWAAFPNAGISEYGKPFKSRLKGKKMPKIDLYPDSKSSYLSAYLRQRKPTASQTD